MEKDAYLPVRAFRKMSLFSKTPEANKVRNELHVTRFLLWSFLSRDSPFQHHVLAFKIGSTFCLAVYSYDYFVNRVVNKYQFKPSGLLDQFMAKKFVILTFPSLEEILQYYHSNETSLAHLLQSTFYFLGFHEKKIAFFANFHFIQLELKGLISVFQPLLQGRTLTTS